MSNQIDLDKLRSALNDLKTAISDTMNVFEVNVVELEHVYYGLDSFPDVRGVIVLDHPPLIGRRVL